MKLDPVSITMIRHELEEVLAILKAKQRLIKLTTTPGWRQLDRLVASLEDAIARYDRLKAFEKFWGEHPKMLFMDARKAFAKTLEKEQRT